MNQNAFILVVVQELGFAVLNDGTGYENGNWTRTTMEAGGELAVLRVGK